MMGVIEIDVRSVSTPGLSSLVPLFKVRLGHKRNLMTIAVNEFSYQYDLHRKFVRRSAGSVP